MTVYERIDAILAERGISRRKLARMAGIKEATLGSIFAKRPEPFPRKYIASIASALNVSVSYLDGVVDNPKEGLELDNIAGEIRNTQIQLNESTNRLRSSMIDIINHTDILGISALIGLAASLLEYAEKDSMYYLSPRGLDWYGRFIALQRNDLKSHNISFDIASTEGESHHVPEEQ